MMTDEGRDPWRTDLAPGPWTWGPTTHRRAVAPEAHLCVATDPKPLAEPDARCQICGAPHFEGDSILCAGCGEPVLRWGWAP